MLQVQRRINDLNKQLRDAPYEMFDRPIHDGWWRSFTVGEHVEDPQVRNKVIKLLPYCNTDWAVSDSEKAKFGDSYYQYREARRKEAEKYKWLYNRYQRLQVFNDEGFKKLPPDLKHLYYKDREYTIKKGTFLKYVGRYVPIVEGELSFIYKERYITGIQSKPGHIESELHKLKEWMDNNHGWALIYGDRDGGHFEKDYIWPVKNLKKGQERHFDWRKEIQKEP